MQLKVSHFNWVTLIRDSDLPSSARLVAFVLHTHMNMDLDMAWPSISRLCHETGLSRATVCKHLDILETKGWLSRERGGPNKGSTRYFPTFPDSVTQTLGGSPPIKLGSPSTKQELYNRTSNKKFYKKGSSLSGDLSEKERREIMMAFGDFDEDTGEVH